MQEANETIEARNGELDAKTEELKSVMKKLIETNAELSKVIFITMGSVMNYDDIYKNFMMMVLVMMIMMAYTI